MTAHNEAITPRPAALDGWPLDFPTPEISVAFNQEHQLITTVTVPGDQGGSFEVWTGANGPGDYEVGDLFADDFNGVDPDIVQRAENWASKKHGEITRMLEQELAQGLAVLRITTNAAGGSNAISNEDLESMVEHARGTVVQAREDYELATTALIARNVLKDYPAASHIRLMVDGGDHADFVSGAIVYDNDDNKLGVYLADAPNIAEDDAYKGEGVVEYLPQLTADPYTSHWAVLNKDGIPNPEYTIELEKAAAWNPRLVA